MRTQIWSSGGGTQSTAIAALICQGALPRPDLSIIVDTERESSTTWDYLDRFVMPALVEAGVTLHRIAKSQYATVDLMRNDDVLIPAFTTESGQIGKLPTFCSNEWKRRVMQRWASEQGVQLADIWIGFTIDELKRVTTPVGKWQHKYPLIERRMTRGDCIAMVKRMGWPEPPKSSCYMCPNKGREGWKWLKQNAPSDFAKAVEFDIKLRDIDENLWLSENGIPLGEDDFSGEDDMFTGRCDSGMCFY